MVSTVTTTTVALISSLGIGVLLGGVATVVLIIYLVERELVAAAGVRFQPLARNLTIAMAALLVTFGVIVVSRLAELISLV